MVVQVTKEFFSQRLFHDVLSTKVHVLRVTSSENILKFHSLTYPHRALEDS